MTRNIQSEIIRSRKIFGIEAAKKPLSSLAGINPPTWVAEGPIYEIFIRNFSEAGTLKGVEEKIPYLKDLGIKTIWLMPVHPIGVQGRKGKTGSPYAIRDHLKVNPHYGSKEDFRKLVDAVHASGMRLIIDLVINHGAIDHVCTRTNPAMFLHDHQGHFTRKIADWSDVIDFDYSNPATRSYMLEIMSYWVREFNIDGYRCDVAGMVPLDFWEEAVEKILKLKSDLYMLAEWQNPLLHVYAFHSYYDWITYWVLSDIYQHKRPAADILHWLKERDKVYPQNTLPLCFTENHDFLRTGRVFGKNNFYPYAAMIFAMPGIPLLYNGQEFGIIKNISLFEQDTFKWGIENQTIYDFYKDLVRLRRENKAFAARNIKVIKNDHPRSVVTFLKSAGDEEVLFILNLDQQRIKMTVSLPALYHNRDWQNLLNSKIIKKGQELKTVVLKPYEVLLWRRCADHLDVAR